MTVPNPTEVGLLSSGTVKTVPYIILHKKKHRQLGGVGGVSNTNSGVTACAVPFF
ncbi:MAG: hypothetical protein U0L70_01410 [Ruminococcus sp.]|nr:hypothetical protein [Ruminococcus sp.]